MGYMMRVRVSSFLVGVAVSSAVAFYYLYKDYTITHHSISSQIKTINESLDARVAALEKLKEAEPGNQVDHFAESQGSLIIKQERRRMIYSSCRDSFLV